MIPSRSLEGILGMQCLAILITYIDAAPPFQRRRFGIVWFGAL